MRSASIARFYPSSNRLPVQPAVPTVARKRAIVLLAQALFMSPSLMNTNAVPYRRTKQGFFSPSVMNRFSRPHVRRVPARRKAGRKLAETGRFRGVCTPFRGQGLRDALWWPGLRLPT